MGHSVKKEMPEVAALTVRQYAVLTNTSIRTVQDLCASGQLPSFKIGRGFRIPLSVLERQMEQAS